MNLTPPSRLQARVALASVLALALGLGVLSVAINLMLRSQLEDDATSVLKARAAAQIATISTTGGKVVVRDGTNDQVLDRQAWVFVGRRALVRPVATADVQRAADALAGTTHAVERDVAEDRFALRAEPVRNDGRGRPIATVVVAVSRAPYEHTERIALFGSLVLDLFVLLAVGGIAWRAVGTALRPVGDMARDAEDWGEHDLDRRFDLGPPVDELTGLAATLDGLLGRIAASRRHEQRFSAEMAHELRTPLAGIQAEAELAARPGRPAEDVRASLAAIVDGTKRMTGVIDTLMAVARGEVAGADGCDALEVITDALDGLPAHGRVTVRGPSGGASARLAADADLVARALLPLVDNAVRHARTRVDVALAVRGGVARISVLDDGDGVAAGEEEAIFAPGYQGRAPASAPGAGNGGAGLGLALARRLARTAGGDVVAEPGQGGRFVLSVPTLGAPV
ncbi:ATP-binding protein [Paraconexibacter antarcticus]|uniref:histidine kinase n=1 Tax=Paraconexibacter antarcticus TaxID=2949664 RepID=A0ABY5DTB7_9ACTN|nr:ATP-binding protein [Paraconexibacter antarcticus]UTI64067.1 ATP-binding protein [Paraconexibacter antarcticus]